jgi:hypothetical protein
MHPVLAATLEAVDTWYVNGDDRLSPQTSPGLLELRVARGNVERALSIVQAVLDGAEAEGLSVAALGRSRRHRPGIGVGKSGMYTALRVEELRRRVPLTSEQMARAQKELTQGKGWAWRVVERGHYVVADGRLRLRLERRYDRSPDARRGWRWSYTDQPSAPLEVQVPDVVETLKIRASSRQRSR